VCKHPICVQIRLSCLGHRRRFLAHSLHCVSLQRTLLFSFLFLCWRLTVPSESGGFHDGGKEEESFQHAKSWKIRMRRFHQLGARSNVFLRPMPMLQDWKFLSWAFAHWRSESQVRYGILEPIPLGIISKKCTHCLLCRVLTAWLCTSVARRCGVLRAASALHAQATVQTLAGTRVLICFWKWTLLTTEGARTTRKPGRSNRRQDTEKNPTLLGLPCLPPWVASCAASSAGIGKVVHLPEHSGARCSSKTSPSPAT